MSWNRKLWGVMHDSPMSEPSLIGESWAADREPVTGAPSRALLFDRRSAARDWCRQKMQKWATGDEILRSWRVRPVRVVESVTATHEQGAGE